MSSSPIATLKRLLPQCLLPDQVRIGSRLARALEEARLGHTGHPPVERWLREAEASIAVRQARASVLKHLSYPKDLPISARKDDIVAALRQHRVVVIAGETGSGKTTQLPKMCLEAGLGLRARIGCTQPRRVAATSISRRLAEELQVEWGHEVGCKIRFSDHSRAETSVKVMTDGILLAEIQGDPLLAEYEAILVDEAHERSINIDFLLGHLNQLLARRDDLKLIITSATIDTEVFSRAFNHAPVIEVSGRMFPVEVRYSPLDEHAEDEGEVTYIDAALNCVASVLGESHSGDALVFMPSERDIRETCDRLENAHGDWLEVVPLFGRLTSAEQQRIFAPGSLRRVVVATNIAETSLTVPRIRYVIDTGLARISRYHPGTRSRRLPIEAISQSSANQRKGRCGRVAEGVCIRLFSDDDFNERRPFVEPEIQRCNLADVILRMKAFRLGEIETFPFIDAPSPAAIRSAYELLQELGALDEQRALTPLGRDLARLPVDPAIGRMVLEADREGALREVLVIAAGLSVQDPRERPLDRKAEAEAAHRRFQHPQSDFLTLLNLWNAYHDELESLKTQNQVRKFCKAHFVSFVRMREWRDIHAQLEDTLADMGGFHWSDQPGSYAAVHRSILTGLWGHIGRREEKNLYRIPGNRQVMVFPGSGLFVKSDTKPARGREPGGERALPKPSPQPDWIVAGELVETSRAFARTVAEIEPDWVIELAPHLIKTTHENPRWDAEAGRVLATEKLLLRGLVLRERAVDYVKVNAEEATTIFIRAALIEEEDEHEPERNAAPPTRPRTRSEPRGQSQVAIATSVCPAGARAEPASVKPRVDRDRVYPFIPHNRQLCEKVEMWQTRMRHRLVDLDEALFQFYTRRLQAIGSFHDLNRLIKSQADARFLFATEADLLGEHADTFDRGAFPDSIAVGSEPVAVGYAYAPGEERDGVTFKLTAAVAELVDPAQLEWAVPALREERVQQLLASLPKSLRRPLMPLPVAAREILQHVDSRAASFVAGMSDFVRRKWGVTIPVEAWPVAALPEHLRPRFEVLGKDGRPVASGRDLREIKERILRHATTSETEAWKQAESRWERYGLARWDLGDLPERVLVAEVVGLPLHAWPGLHWENGEVNLRLFRKPDEAIAATREGLPRLAEKVLSRELAWLEKDLRALQAFAPLYVTFGAAEEFSASAWEHLRRHLLCPATLPPLTTTGFNAYVETARQRIPGLAPQFADLVGAVLKKRQEAMTCRRPLPKMAVEVAALVPAGFLAQTPFERLRHLPRYLQALIVRAERAALSPPKDAEKARRVEPYVRAAQELSAKPPATPEWREKLQRFLTLVEEFKVSVFAQELGTAEPVSTKRLDEALAALRAPRQS